MPDLDFTGLEQAARSAFKPHYPDVVRRAGRRRRHARTAGAAAVAVAVAAAGGGATLVLRRGDPATGISSPTPSASPFIAPQLPPGTAIVRRGTPAVGDIDHLYETFSRCVADTCTQHVAVTADRGRTWQTCDIPPADGSHGPVWAVAPLTLVRNGDGTWRTGEAEPGWWASTDGAKTWRAITIGEVDAIPAGWRVIAGGSRVIAADPATGEVVRLRAAPPPKLAVVAATPPDAGIWVSGYARSDAQELVGEGSMVSVSRDGGRTWTSHTLSEPLEEGGAYTNGSAVIATADGRTVYAVGRLGADLRIHRSTDGGVTWAPTGARTRIGASALIDAAAGPDGTLELAVWVPGQDALRRYRSTDGGATVEKIGSAPGAYARAVSGGLVEMYGPDRGVIWVRPDGGEWTKVTVPEPK
jgi:hypothetical protein